MNKKKFFSVLISLTIPICGFNSYSYAKEAPPEQIVVPTDVEVILPTPAEVMFIFGKLNKRVFVPTNFPVISNNRYKLIMNFAICTADASAAIKNRDVGAFQNVSKNIIAYAFALDIDRKIIKKALDVNELVGQGEWKKVDLLLDVMREQILLSLKMQRKTSEVSLASLIGWLEGLYIMTETIKDSFDTKYDDSFYLGNTIKQLLKNLENLPDDVKNFKEYSKIVKVLPRVNRITNKEHITKKEFMTLNKLLKEIRQSIIS